MASTQACPVESIPTGLEVRRGMPGVAYPEDVLLRLPARARRTIDLTAMYWSPLPDPTSADESGFSEAQLDAFGAGHGRALYQALLDAAARGVQIRILQSPGFGGQKQESDALRAQHPQRVEIQQVKMPDWYGSGSMHQKIWVFDHAHLYLGSANMDWKSISQVKERGVAVENCPPIAQDAGRYFDAGWVFSGTPVRTAAAFDPPAGIWRTVPDWSALVPPGERRRSPLDDARYGTTCSRENPLEVELGGRQATRSTSRARRARSAGPAAASTARPWCRPSSTPASRSASASWTSRP